MKCRSERVEGDHRQDDSKLTLAEGLHYSNLHVSDSIPYMCVHAIALLLISHECFNDASAELAEPQRWL